MIAANEHPLANSLTGALIVALISGLFVYTDWWLTYGLITEIGVLAHLISSIYFLLGISAYIFIHLKRTLKSRRNSAFFSGILTFAICVVSLYSGVKLLLPLRYEPGESGSIAALHLLASLCLFLFFALHGLLSRFSKSTNKSTSKNNTPTPHIDKSAVTSSLIWALASTTVASLLVLLFWLPNTASQNPALIDNYSYSYGDNPFEPSKTTTPDNQFVPHQLITQSEKCSSCHADIFKQWNQSAHRYAAADPSYVKNVGLLEQLKGIESTRYCEGCHAPAALLTGQLTKGGMHGGTPETVAFNEGISCLSCHSMGAINNTEGVGSYHFVAADNSPLLNSKNYLSETLANYLISASPGKHTALFNNSVTSQAQSCASCHAQFMDKEMNDWGWVKMQDEYTAWLESPYSGHGGENFSTGDVTTCQNCHMPLMPSKDPSAGVDGMILSHNFATANTVIPSYFGDQEQLNNVIDFIQSNKLRVTIEPPKGNPLLSHATSISSEKLNHKEAPMHFYAGTNSEVNIAVSNTGVGHDFPGGSTDIQEAWLHFQIVDSTGEILFESGRDNSSKGSQAIYKTVPVDRHGKAVWKHDLFNVVGDAFKNVIPSGKTDIVNISFHLPQRAKGPVSLHASLRYRKFTPAYEAWVFDKEPIDIPEVEVARSTIIVPVRIEVPAS